MLMTPPELLEQVKASVRRITAEKAYAECRDCEAVIIDVREPGEVMGQPVEGSINIPRGVLEMKIGELAPSADQPIYLHCATSMRAILAAEQLQRLGYRQVTVISCPLADICSAQQQARR